MEESKYKIMAIDLGCITNCETIDTGELATIDGVYLLKGVFNGRVQEFTGDFLIGEEINFTNTANENYCYENAVLFDPSGAIVETFTFNTKTKVI